VLWNLGAILGLGSDPNNQVASIGWATFFVVGCLSLIFGLIGALLVKPLICPRGRLLKERRGEEDVVELRNVHYGFVQAANQMYAERAAILMPTQAPENLPLPPVSN
jgi:hypothetical protein